MRLRARYNGGMADRLFLTSRLLSAADVVHGFSVRTGGVSRGPYASLNLGRGVGDEPAAVEENLRRLAEAAGLAGPRAFAAAHQVHGDRVVGAAAGGAFSEIFPQSGPAQTEAAAAAGTIGADPVVESPIAAAAAIRADAGVALEPGVAAAAAIRADAVVAPDFGVAAAAAIRADAVVALEPGVAAAVRVADCVPVLLYAPDHGVAAAVHSGWRGTRAAIAARGVRALQHVCGADPAQVLAAVGPCIERCCYEVGQDLAALFRSLFGPDAADDPAATEKPHLDLRYCVEAALRSAGVRQERIEHAGGCTSCDISACFSHRRDRGTTGRHMAFAASRSL
jgi:polyphenol oxidase